MSIDSVHLGKQDSKALNSRPLTNAPEILALKKLLKTLNSIICRLDSIYYDFKLI